MDEDIFLTCQNMLNNFSFLKRENSNFKFLTRFRDSDMKFYRLRKFLELRVKTKNRSKLSKLSLRQSLLWLFWVEFSSNFKGRRYVSSNLFELHKCEDLWWQLAKKKYILFRVIWRKTPALSRLVLSKLVLSWTQR